MKAKLAHVVALAGALSSLWAEEGQARDARVVFLNPGRYMVDAGWTERSVLMQAAGDQLGVDLEVVYADRDRLKMAEQARAVAARADPPDYAIVVNEKEQGLELLEAFRGTKTKLLLMHNDLTPDQRRQVGNERGELTNWIGTLLTDERAAARGLVAALFERTTSVPKILGIGGDTATPVSFEREDAVRQAVQEFGRGEILQVVPGNWTRDDSREKARALLARYPEATMFWAANDTMALGVHDAIVEIDRQGSIVVGGIGGFPKAIDSVASGELTASAAGNALIGAWAMVLIHDYHRGRDFASSGNPRIVAPTVAVVADPATAARYREMIQRPSRINFRRFSKAANQNLKAYDFSFQAVLAAAR